MALSLSLLLGVQIVALRTMLRRRERREEKIVQRWRPLLNAAIMDDAPALLPRLAARDRIVFFKLWVHLHASLRGSATEALNGVGYRIGADAVARDLLRSGNRAERLLATLALGYMRDREAWPALLAQSGVADTMLSLYAAWALVGIDVGAAAAELADAVIDRADWSLSQVVTVMQDARVALAPLLVRRMGPRGAPGTMDKDQLARALRIAEGLRMVLPALVQKQLLTHPSVEVLVVALRMVSHPALLRRVRAYAAHPDWRVRVQAGKTLGQIGERADVAILTRLLADEQWWVRYRAAQALVGLPFYGRDEVEALAAGADDRFVGDILRQVLAERGVA
ncbi:HEAT repeat domain-containing protein [Massilia glaciei]|uniref:HEAT repeat domain-containing protein n=1 Tax=Massilia glaciei TaxID=1524097 RepID=A0A2U2HHJ9_9BURK|nr:HEAT repeat domain-containing protein [Massilia glaciei]PWF45378.1 HEAT repeat domain-containing protein [Massilia glaciei]